MGSPGQGLTAGGLKVFINRGDGVFYRVDESVFPVIESNNISGFENFPPQYTVLRRSTPIDLGNVNGLDFVSFRFSPFSSSDQQVAMFIYRSKAPLDRGEFKDGFYAFGMMGVAGQVAKTLGAVFGASTVNNKKYVGIGLSLLDGGMTYEALMGLALGVKLGNALSHATVVNLLHTNVMGAAPTQAERDFYVGLLDSGVYNPMSLGVLAAETPLNATNIDLVGLSQTGLEFLPV